MHPKWLVRLTIEEHQQLLPSSNQAIIINLIERACTYLKKEGLLDTLQRAIIIITEQGK